MNVEIVAPKRGEIARSITLPSYRLLPHQEATLYAKVPGYLERVSPGIESERVSPGIMNTIHVHYFPFSGPDPFTFTLASIRL